MSLSGGGAATVIGVGVALGIAFGAAAFKASSLRGDMNLKWSRRVSFAAAALDEKTFAQLSAMEDDLADIATKEFDPSEAISDPTTLLKEAEAAVKFFRARQRMNRDVQQLCNVCPAILASFIGLFVTDVPATLYFAELWRLAWLEVFCLTLFSVFGAAGVISVAIYARMQNRLASAEILAGSAGQITFQRGDDSE